MCNFQDIKSGIELPSYLHSSHTLKAVNSVKACLNGTCFALLVKFKFSKAMLLYSHFLISVMCFGKCIFLLKEDHRRA